MTVMTIAWELLTAKQQVLLLPLMSYAIGKDPQLLGDESVPLPDTTFANMWQAWNQLDRLSLSVWVSEASISDITASLKFLAEQSPDAKIKEIVEYYTQ